MKSNSFDDKERDLFRITDDGVFICNFDFEAFSIPKGYLWDVIDDLAKLNQCFSDFTAPRQMAIHDQFENMGDVFSLGHWGDVLFDSMNLQEISAEVQVDVLVNKLLKKGGLSLASKLWKTWNLNGIFEEYFKARIATLLEQIEIKNTNAKLRAFKSMYWAPRWTSVNLSIFSSIKPISLPYYDDRMCQFICTVPEDYLKNRKLQIAYIKSRTPELAKIIWQDHRPFNLNNFRLNRAPYNLPYKVKHKLSRTIRGIIGKPYVQRNWELQFVGKENEEKLKEKLFNYKHEALVPKAIVNYYYDLFLKDDKVQHAHPINMLLVLSKFNEMRNDA